MLTPKKILYYANHFIFKKDDENIEVLAGRFNFNFNKVEFIGLSNERCRKYERIISDQINFDGSYYKIMPYVFSILVPCNIFSMKSMIEIAYVNFNRKGMTDNTVKVYGSLKSNDCTHFHSFEEALDYFKIKL